MTDGGSKKNAEISQTLKNLQVNLTWGTIFSQNGVGMLDFDGFWGVAT